MIASVLDFSRNPFRFDQGFGGTHDEKRITLTDCPGNGILYTGAASDPFSVNPSFGNVARFEISREPIYNGAVALRIADKNPY